MERIDYAAVKIYPCDLNTPMIITGLRHPEIYEYLWEKGIRFEKDKAEVYNEFFEHFESECPIAPICFLKESIITSAKIKSGVSPSVAGVVTRTENWSVK